MDCSILHTVLLAIILLFTITITCYHCAKYKSKPKKLIAVLKIKKRRIMNLKKFLLGIALQLLLFR